MPLLCHTVSSRPVSTSIFKTPPQEGDLKGMSGLSLLSCPLCCSKSLPKRTSLSTLLVRDMFFHTHMCVVTSPCYTDKYMLLLNWFKQPIGTNRHWNTQNFAGSCHAGSTHAPNLNRFFLSPPQLHKFLGIPSKSSYYVASLCWWRTTTSLTILGAITFIHNWHHIGLRAANWILLAVISIVG